MQFTILFLLGVLSVSQSLFAQERPEQDCVGAVKICNDTTFMVSINYAGRGLVADVPDGSTCLTNEENNSAWFYFDVDSAGEIVFIIEPFGESDYDFAVYKTNDCDEILNGDVNTIRCSYFAYGPSNLPPNNNPLTGLAVGATDTTADIVGSLFLKPLQVNAGERYYLVVDNFVADTSGFTIKFLGSTAKISTDSICSPLVAGLRKSNVQLDHQFTIVPNPAQQQVVISSKNNALLNTIELYNLQGKQVNAEYSIKENAAYMNVSHLSKGFYYVHIATLQGDMVIKKLAVH